MSTQSTTGCPHIPPSPSPRTVYCSKSLCHPTTPARPPLCPLATASHSPHPCMILPPQDGGSSAVTC
ncbi:hypothetical protein BD779DRAFT_1578368 [Infundibulicybe gibba]|nr:hypothetical protein BD779DRAFT_1578368 [Infundibulicybe gibba]